MGSLLTVAEAMTTEVLAVSPDTSLQTAARLFSTRHITGAPVIDAEGHVLGVVTQTDLVDPDRDRSQQPASSVYYRIADGRTIGEGDALVENDAVVGDVMSPVVLAIGPGAPLQEAMRTMLSESMHRLLVAENRKLVGIITTMDVMRAIERRLVETPDVSLGALLRG